jgi:predicted RNA-binding Zn-ribbon protein involved in translation (DUF1610 family)
MPCPLYESAAKPEVRSMSERHCPDCDIQMEKTNVTAEGVGDLYVETERDGGVLDRLGVGHQTSLHAFLCPECGLTQLYADLSE